MRKHVRRAGELRLVAVVLLAAVLLLACGGDDNPPEYVFFSGGESGVYYPTAQIIARLANEAGAGFELTVRASDGSAENAKALGDGSADFALIQSDIAVYAREGGLGFDAPVTGIVGLAALYPEHVQIVTLAGSGIDNLIDLRGKTVAVGALGSGTAENAREILRAADLSFSALGKVEYMGASEAVEALASGDIDAAFFTFGLGTPAIAQLAAEHPVAFVPVEGAVRQRLLREYSYYVAGDITAGSYAGLDRDVPTVTVTALLVAREGVPESAVQAVLNAVFAHLDAFDGGRLSEMTLESAQSGLSLPLHPGASRYYAGR